MKKDYTLRICTQTRKYLTLVNLIIKKNWRHILSNWRPAACLRWRQMMASGSGMISSDFWAISIRNNNNNNNFIYKCILYKGLVPQIDIKLVEAGQDEHENRNGKKITINYKHASSLHQHQLAQSGTMIVQASLVISYFSLFQLTLDVINHFTQWYVDWVIVERWGPSRVTYRESRPIYRESRVTCQEK